MAPWEGTHRKAIGARLELLRVALEYEKKAPFARLLELSPQGYGNYVSGKNQPDLTMANKIAAKTGATLDYIYRGNLDHLPHKLAIAVQAAMKRNGQATA